jgi:hypothetical protein
MRCEEDFFDNRELVLVFVARRLKEALALEKVFDAAGLDYLVEPAPFQSGILFRAQRIGAFFYVTPEMEGRSRDVLIENGFKPHAKP